MKNKMFEAIREVVNKSEKIFLNCKNVRIGYAKDMPIKGFRYLVDIYDLNLEDNKYTCENVCTSKVEEVIYTTQKSEMEDLRNPSTFIYFVKTISKDLYITIFYQRYLDDYAVKNAYATDIPKASEELLIQSFAFGNILLLESAKLSKEEIPKKKVVVEKVFKICDEIYVITTSENYCYIIQIK